MSRTIKGSKGAGYDLGSKRYSKFFLPPGSYSKMLTHRHERRKAKTEVAKSN